MESEERVQRLCILETWMIHRTVKSDMIVLLKSLAFMPATANELTIADVRRTLREFLDLGE